MAFDTNVLSTIQWRLIATLALILICIFLIFISELTIGQDLIVSAIAGILVLATAGIWVAYFAEREAHRTIKKASGEIQSSTELIRDCAAVGLLQVFPSADDTNYQNFLERQLARANPQLGIEMLGIACQGVFHADCGPSYAQIKKLADLETPLRIVLQHPLCEPAISRGIREDRNRTKVDGYPSSTLVGDVLQSCEGIVALGAEPHVEARLCPIALYCRAIFLDQITIYEPHHFGDDNQRASIGTPVFIFSRHCNFSRNLWEHFEFLWRVGQDRVVSSHTIDRIRNARFGEDIVLQNYVKRVRPDLCG